MSGSGRGPEVAFPVDLIHHPVLILVEFVIQDSEDAKPSGLQPPLPRRILPFSADVDVAAQFDEECQAGAIEIDDEWDDWLLSPEFMVGKPPIAQLSPEDRFGRRRVSSEFARVD